MEKSNLTPGLPHMDGRDVAVIRDFASLPKGCRVLIYGPNSVGMNLYESLKILRPDVRIVAFVHSFKEYELDGLKVILPRNIDSPGLAYDWVLVTHLGRLGDVLPNLAHLDPRKVAVCFATTFNFFGERKPVEIPNIQSRAQAIRTALADEKDRSAWDAVSEGIQTKSLLPLWQYLQKYGAAHETYLEHVKLPKSAVVVEGGLFDGLSTLRFAEAVGEGGAVIGFEPLDFQVLRDNLQAKPVLAARIKIIKAALWSERTTLSFLEDAGASHVSGGGANESAARAVQVPACTLDDYVSESGLDRLDLLKLDIEGAEIHALRGAAKTIARFRPALAITIYHGTNQFFEVPEYLVSTLQNYRFYMTAHNPAGIDVVLHCLPR